MDCVFCFVSLTTKKEKEDEGKTENKTDHSFDSLERLSQVKFDESRSENAVAILFIPSIPIMFSAKKKKN